ncbi:hypothetical protein [Streptomyces mirabilis]|uniref:hypothetical protein n=1 Tax=Streptomyces mirabilis TaxID=68239 RepID=UPI0036EEFA18
MAQPTTQIGRKKRGVTEQNAHRAPFLSKAAERPGLDLAGEFLILSRSLLHYEATVLVAAINEWL